MYVLGLWSWSPISSIVCHHTTLLPPDSSQEHVLEQKIPRIIAEKVCTGPFGQRRSILPSFACFRSGKCILQEPVLSHIVRMFIKTA